MTTEELQPKIRQFAVRQEKGVPKEMKKRWIIQF